ncbi:MFS transporter [Sunxiuqinia sp. A32]|uniref:MFS transporter n=1 Tax=Sunxiuqinia sp. A32 TaxID=3461496 RepID=UPI004045FAD4
MHRLFKDKTKLGVFIAVTFGYGMFYVCRLSISVLKKSIVDDGFLSESQIGIIGSALFFSYAIGKLFNGFLADRLNIRFFMSGALLICVLVNFMLGVKVAFTLFVVLWAINGWFQSVGSPSSIIALKRWYSEKSFGTVYGFWSASHNIGEAVSFIVIAFIVSVFGWQYGFFSAALLGLLGVCVIFFFLIPRPTGILQSEILVDEPGNIGKMQLAVLKNPEIWILAIASAFMYIARYAVNSWGIFFLETEKNYSVIQASTLISISSIFGVVGTVFSGLLSDKLFKGNRSLPAVIMSAINLLALILFLVVPAGYYIFDITSMVLFGISIGVLICFLGGLMAVEIAPNEATGAAVGMIGISSYIAAGIQDIVSGNLIESNKRILSGVSSYNFSSIKYFWVSAALISLALLIFIWNKHRQNSSRMSRTEYKILRRYY